MARRPAWQRIIQRINDLIGEPPPRPPREPGQWPPEPEPPLPPEPPIEPPEGPGDDYGYIHVVDDFGIDRGTQSWDQWYRDTLLNSDAFHGKFGYDFDNITLIYLLEEILDIDWDWDQWKIDYARAQAGAA